MHNTVRNGDQFNRKYAPVPDSIVEFVSVLDWKEFRDSVTAFSFLIAAVAALIAALRVTRIIEALKAFRSARDEVGELLSAIDSLERLTPKIKAAAADLNEDVGELELQRAGERAPAGEVPEVAGQERQRWQEVRTVWREIRDGIEEVVAGLDGRVRRPYSNIARTNLNELIDKLETDGHLAEARANTARAANQRFLQLRPRPGNTTDQDVENFRDYRNGFFPAA